VKKLSDILNAVEVLERTAKGDPAVASLCFDSRKAGTDCVFFAIPGTLTDGHHYIGMALKAGARAIVCERIPDKPPSDAILIRVPDTAIALGHAAASWFGHPSEKLSLIGITGTNGKTTVATLLHGLFSGAGSGAGLISTVRNLVGDEEKEASHTTPDPMQINSLLAEMAEAGCRHCFMEVSSHAIHQKRIAGLKFTGGIFTNITHEHLDYHKSFRDYINVKKSFFDQLQEGAFALVNRDDRNAQVMLQNTVAGRSTYGLKGPADYKGKVLESHLDGMQMTIGDREVWTRLTGSFNASNILAVFGCSMLCGLDREEVLTILSRLSPVRGRFETLHSEEGITAIVDYAHTPDALENVLGTIARLSGSKAQVITVVGAGGDRDPAKRPLMGKVAAELSQKLILTSDNPRTEKPEDIIAQMKEGIPEETRKSVLTITDRREAIRTAIMLAGAGDVILVAGKGHETSQEIGGKKHHFDDMEILRELLKKN
jgi:UDP-N-acetylmuramoyl-L-alanyl-D-glutamate--2,6-diaminopimelate ligase